MMCVTYAHIIGASQRRQLRQQLGPDFDIDTHFTPTYEPWDQRLCLAPNGDLFSGIRDGAVSVVTDRIDTFTEKGIRLESGRDLEADIVVTATGLNLRPLGGLELKIDGEVVGYVARAVDRLPKQGSKLPWRLYQNYIFDLLLLRYGRLRDPAMEFSI